MGVDNKLLMDAVAAINARFSSGNSVPVDRAWVSYAEWKNLQYALALALTPPEGWVLVPVEPTEEMIAAAWRYGDGDDAPDPVYSWRAMLAARPEVKP